MPSIPEPIAKRRMIKGRSIGTTYRWRWHPTCGGG
jgi:hypothetical protein